MLLNWLQTLIAVIQYVWPFRKVDQWERGVLYVWNRWWCHWPARKVDWTVGPGIWPILPYFTDVRAAPVVRGVTATPLQQIEDRDGKPLLFSAAMTWRIYDAASAFNNVDRVLETGQELLSAVCAEKLAEVGADRLDGPARKRLINSMTKWLNEELEFMGCTVDSLRFTNFARGMQGVRTLRLLTDTALLTDYQQGT
jgi:regulator of protease activity HflC (stomatin/prohibitin superfamily)